MFWERAVTTRRIGGIGGAVAAFAVVAAAPALLRLDPSGYAHVLIAWSFATAGVLAWLRRPERSLGRILLVISSLWSLWGVRLHDEPLAWTVGQVSGNLWAVGLVYLLLVFPGSRLHSKRDGLLFACAVVIGVVLDDLVGIAFIDCRDHGYSTADCDGKNLIHVSGHAQLAENAVLAAQIGAVVLLAALGWEIRRRWRHTSTLERRASTPVLLGSLGAVGVYVVLSVLTDRVAFLERHEATLWDFGLVAFGAVPFSFLVGLLRAHARRVRIGDLVIELGELPDPARLEGSLRRALEDPSLIAGIWEPDTGRYRTPDGSLLELPGEREAQVATFLDRGAEPLAVIVHDRALLDDAALVESVKAATRLAVENERLNDELIAQLAEVHASRARIVQATDEARRRIERDLHDGAQQRLVGLSLSLRLLAQRLDTEPVVEIQHALETVQRELRDAIGELRDVARGIHPAILTDQGLAAALEALAERSQMRVKLAALPHQRVPKPVETAAYYVCAEALSNSAKHGAATRVVIAATVVEDRLELAVTDDGRGGASLQTGGGLRGLADRVASLGGAFHLASPPGLGTRLHISFPLQEHVPGSSPTGLTEVPRAADHQEVPRRDRSGRAQHRALLVVRSVEASFGGTSALANVDLELSAGELVAVLGTNGAGKSTLLRVIAGLSPPAAGTVMFRGEDVTYHPTESRAGWGITYIPGDKGVFSSLTVLDNLRVFATGAPNKEAAARLAATMDLFPILRARSREVAGRLSRGEQRVLALAKAMVVRPTLLLIDELCLGLDEPAADQILELIASLHETGITVMFVDQSSDRALRIAHRSVFLDAGQIVFDGAPDELAGRTDLLRAVFVPSELTGA